MLDSLYIKCSFVVYLYSCCTVLSRTMCSCVCSYNIKGVFSLMIIHKLFAH